MAKQAVNPAARFTHHYMSVTAGRRSKRGLYFYLRILLWLLVIWGLLLGLKNVIYQLSDPTKGKPPVQISKV